MSQLLHAKQKPPIVYAKQILLILGFVILLMWLMQPYMHNKTNVMPHNYFSYGMKCLNHFQHIENNHNYKLMNTYAKTVLKTKDMVLIQAKNLSTDKQLQIECIYADNQLISLSVNNEKITL